ncbi:MAG: outer membrane protein TolC [Saprospiraceae bacterium]|jgi:outer membrane protein
MKRYKNKISETCGISGRFSIYIVLIFGFSPIFGQTQLSLSDAIKTGLENNFQIQISEQRIDIAKNNNNLAQAGKYPNIDLNLISGNGIQDINNPASFLDGTTITSLGVTPNVDMQWVLFDGYKVRINKQRLERLEFQSSGNKELVVENTIQAIILSYYRAVIEQEKIGVFKEVLKLSRDRYDYQVIRRDLGVGSKFNILQTKDAYLSDSINLKFQETALDNAIQNLNLTMGVEDLRTTYMLMDLLEYNRIDYEADELQQKMFANNQNLKNQFLNLQLLKTETDFQSSNKMPRLSMNTGVSYALSQNFLGDLSATGRTFQYYLNFSLSYNIYDAGRTKRAIENAIVNEKIGQLTIDDQKRTLRGQLHMNVANYNHQADIIELNDARVSNAKENLEVAEERFKSGVITSFDYRNVQLAYIRAALTKLEAVYNLKTTETDIIRLTGGIVGF